MTLYQNGLLLCFFLSTLLIGSAAQATVTEDGKVHPGNKRFQLGLEYFAPTEDDRKIRTVNLNAYYLLNKTRFPRLSFLVGVTATFASGEITQLEGDINQGTLHEVTYESDAVGIGPGVSTALRLCRIDRFALSLEAAGNIIFYNRDFPAGGDRYNFMWRGGPVLKYSIHQGQEIGLGFHWMHVSNGQGLGPQNPSYDSHGLNIQYSMFF